MKHLKIYEIFEDDEQLYKKYLPQFKGKVFIEKPTEKFFKSSLRFSLIIIDSVYLIKSEDKVLDSDSYEINAYPVFQRHEYSNGDSYGFTNRSKIYNKDEFNKIDFMTINEFYEKYTDNYKQILNIVLDKIEKNKEGTIKNMSEKMLKKLTIPEVEPIINSRKYNL